MDPLAEAHYERLMSLPRGGPMVMSVLLRALVAAVFFAGCGLIVADVGPQYGWATGASGLPGRFEVHDCYKSGTGPRKYQPTECSGVLRTPEGRLVDKLARTQDSDGLQAGKTSDIRYTAAGAIHQTGTGPLLEAIAGSLFAAATATGGIAVLLLAFRRVKPAHPWFTRDAKVRKWPARLGVAGGLGFAAAGQVCWLVSQGF